MRFPIHLLLALFFLQITACNSDQTRALAASVDRPEAPGRRELSRTLRTRGEITLVYSPGSEELRRVAQQFADMSDRMPIHLVSADSFAREDLSEKILLVLGAPATNWVSAELSRRLPFKLAEDAIELDDTTFTGATLVFTLPLYPSPYNRHLPVIWLTGASDQVIAGQLAQNLQQGWFPLGWSAAGYELYLKEERIWLGFFDDHDWSPDPNLRFDLSNAHDLSMETEHFHFLAKKNRIPETQVVPLAQACEAAAQAVRAFTGVDKKLPKFKICLYPSAEEKGLRLNDTHQSNVDFEKGEVHMVFDEIFSSNLIGKENELLVRNLLGRPKLTALEKGLAITFTEKWQMKGYRYWAQRLFDSGNGPPLTTLLDNEQWPGASDLVYDPMAASFVDFLIATWGREVFLERYLAWTPTPAEMTRLERDWYRALGTNSLPAAEITFEKDPLPFLCGFNFAHEGYAIFNGYGSRKAAESLQRMSELGSTAAAVIPYSFLRNPEQPALIPIADRAGSENDESVINALYATRRNGMVSILKPQIWFGGGHWPGDVMMQNEADWQAFFQYYYEWIRHYAMLAEIHDVDLLVVGTEFAKATLAREADWRTLIRKIRKLYHGKITYAANWGDEFENVGFWDELDYIGLDCYYPLSKNQEATYQELESNFRSVLQKVEKVQKKFNKPLLFTEIGFRSIPAPWINPHADANGADYHSEHQRQCYEIVLKNLQGKDWCQGVLWWKWPSYLEHRPSRNTDFSPTGKPSEQVVAEWFGKLNGKN